MPRVRSFAILVLIALPISSLPANDVPTYTEFLSSKRVFCVSAGKIIETSNAQRCANDHLGEAFDTRKEAERAIAKDGGGAGSNSAAEADLELIDSGTGFVINNNYVVTAHHVIEDCKAVGVRHKHTSYETSVASTDQKNDLGLLRLKGSIPTSAKLRAGSPLRLGEVVAVYGYPLAGLLSKSANITQGNVNSLAGIGNDSGTIQYDAASQPGNSGGPLLDSSGNVIGVISSSLNKRYYDLTGHIPQNVNFAIKSNLVEGFLVSNGVRYDQAESVQQLNLVELAPKAEEFTVFVGCWK